MSCKYCGLNTQHQTLVDCIYALREYIGYLNSMLPSGSEVVRAPLSRTTSFRLWIDGEITPIGIQRIQRYVTGLLDSFDDEPLDVETANRTPIVRSAENGESSNA